MGFLRLSNELVRQKKVQLENIFLTEYMPNAPSDFLKVYLAGLSFAHNEDNDLVSIALLLNLDTSQVVEAFSYWKNEGLVNFTLEPMSVEYLPVQPKSYQIKKYSKTKYKDFNDRLHTMISGRDITQNEYYQYYEFLESNNIEPAALLTVIGYCIRLKGSSITYSYILTVAKNLINEGYRTFDKIEERLNDLDLGESDVKNILKVLGAKRAVDLNDKTSFAKWKDEFGFSLATISAIAKRVKGGGMRTLDMLLTRYYQNRVMSISEIDVFENNRQKMYAMVSEVLKKLGLRYDSLEHIIENYVVKWVSYGFQSDVLISLADYSFKNNIRDMVRFDEVVEKFYRKGIISKESMAEFVDEGIKRDGEIKELFTKLKIDRFITQRDRDIFKNWTQNWGFSKDIIEHALELAKTKEHPISYMNACLAAYFEKGLKTITDIKKESAPLPKETVRKSDNFVSRTLSAEEINAMFGRLDESDVTP